MGHTQVEYETGYLSVSFVQFVSWTSKILIKAPGFSRNQIGRLRNISTLLPRFFVLVLGKPLFFDCREV